ncbi:proprotein convertase subtilisin/kexin type 4 [Elysia marginata]|uniref:Proprotein convertase subtilisin/kexin type 4 n=1 Tax=Elysia marginata TaxID=1093978 RepID=A0AAV4HDL4_9GAST|nr:proprotein convertase subtilisin/kexin type 4 [Elysia marginata]
MNVREAWDMGYTGKGVVVTILDDGIERDHPDLVQNFGSRVDFLVPVYFIMARPDAQGPLVLGALIRRAWPASYNCKLSHRQTQMEHRSAAAPVCLGGGLSDGKIALQPA